MYKQNKSISVVIVTYNSESDIFDCINSIYKYNDIGDALEIIVVDNDSVGVDDMFSIIRIRFGKDIILIKNDKNGGYGQGNNLGIKNASAPVIMIINPDVRLIQPLFKKATETFGKNKVAMLGMTQLLSENIKAASFVFATKYRSALTQLVEKVCLKLDLFIPFKMCFAGACFFINKKIFEEIGLFDESIFMYCEERDVYFRIKNKGIILYDNKLRYLHLVAERSLSLNTIKNIYTSKLRLCNKYNFNTHKLKRIEKNLARYHIVLGFIKHDKIYKQIHKEWLRYLKEH